MMCRLYNYISPLSWGPLLYLAVMYVAVLPSAAHATLMVSAAVGGVQVLHCEDNQGCDLNGALGVLELPNLNFGGVQVNGSVSEATVGPLNILNTSSLNIVNGTGAAVQIEAAVSATDFAAPVSSYAISTAGTFQTAIGSDILTSWFADPFNAQGAETFGDTEGTLLDSFFKAAALPADAYSYSAAGLFGGALPFSMTQHLLLNLVAGGQLVNRGQTEIMSVPEPGSLMLLGAGLLLAGAMWRRRNKIPRSVKSMAYTEISPINPENYSQNYSATGNE